MSRISVALAVLSTLSLVACDDRKSSSTPAPVTVTQLAIGDGNCPYGGASLASGGVTAYACNGADGTNGSQGSQGIQGIQGIQGLQGLPGAPAPYQTRENVYCDTVVASSYADAASRSLIIASCRDPNDLPLSGACEQFDRVDVSNPTNRAVGWNAPPSTIGKAEFRCGWAAGGVNVKLDTVPNATASICCVDVP
jgi:hypothetical protein